MAEPKRTELKVGRKRAVLVAVVTPEDRYAPGEHPLDELRGLVKTAGVTVAGTLIQKKQHVEPATCLGSGKLAELKELVAREKADLIIFDNNLSPSQGRALEQETGSIIVDRSEVILDIFASHARTHEARLQVELAQLLYQRPRLKKMWGHLSREGGAGGYARGTGEQQIEIDRRLIDARVAELRSRLREVEQHRERMVAQRRQHHTVSLVGYTNAGKSTLMNALTGADAYVADQLFATLDTRTRAWDVPHWGRILLSDTVGFIRNLPHHLVASFRSTLEEARHADLLLHVVDASHPAAEEQIRTVNEVLHEIGIDATSALLVLNKIDQVADRSLVDVLRAKHPFAISVSALTRQGLDRLARTVAEQFGGGFVEADIDAPAANGRLHAYLAEHAELLGTSYHDDRVRFHCRLARRFTADLPGDDVRCTVRGDGVAAPRGERSNGTPPAS